MKKLRCLIVEDEPIAAEITQSYIEQVSFLQLESICVNAIAAFELLKEKPVDVIFLDIHLPKLKGIEFLKTLKHRPKIIITSAYKQYALEGFELEITDYLLKPFSFTRFLLAVNRLQTHEGKTETADKTQSKKERQYYYFNVNKKTVKIYADEILYAESLKDYVKIFTIEKVIISKFQLGELNIFLNSINFLRIHRSFIIAKDKMESISSAEIEIRGKSLPIGRTYLSSVKEEFGLQ
jgi:DNA-binding LytR/AlgR family response regulator